MKVSLPKSIDQHRVQLPGYVETQAGSIEGAFLIPYRNRKLKVISGCGDGWDHVSVSLNTRCPRWDEMCFIKGIFFEAEETVIQLHPPESEYINFNPHVLHLWRPWNFTIQLPPGWMIA